MHLGSGRGLRFEFKVRQLIRDGEVRRPGYCGFRRFGCEEG